MKLYPSGSDKESINNLMGTIQKSLKEVAGMSPNWSIYRVPKRLRQVNPDAYTPQLISIGPLHHNLAGLADMHEHKLRYTHSLLRRAGARHHNNPKDEEEPLRTCVQMILDAEIEVRDWYAPSIELSPQELAKMLLLDGCFVLELFLRNKYYSSSLILQEDDDPIFSSEWMLPAFRRDLALLENQIPFFVLHRLFYIVVDHNANLQADYLPIMALEFFQLALVYPTSLVLAPVIVGGGSAPRENHECKHLLDLLFKSQFTWPPRSQTKTKSSQLAQRPKTCATLKTVLRNVKSLVDGGVVIKKAETDNNLSDFSFRNGELYIPHLHIYWWTDSLFRNLIAFEHCCPNNVDSQIQQYIVSYIVLMEQLVKTGDDIDLLMKEGIITTEVGGSEDVTHLFKDLSKQIAIKTFQFEELCEEVSKYYNSKWRGYLHEFRRRYLKTPLTIASLVAAVVFLGCTILQAIYTVKRGFHSDKRTHS